MAGEPRLTSARGDQEDEEGSPMRSFVATGSIVLPEPKYEEGEKAFIEFEDPRKAKEIVTVASKGRWNDSKQQNEYRLKLKDGSWYQNGDWIEERLLNARP